MPPLIESYLAFRHCAPTIAEDSDPSPLNDPTCLTSTYQSFQSAKEILLMNQAPFDKAQMAVTELDIATFKARHGAAPYVCRRARCERSLIGFKTANERAKHERIHTQKFCCSDSSCEFAQHGLSSRSALNQHNRKYHRDIQNTDVPPLLMEQTEENPMGIVGMDNFDFDIGPANDVLDGYDFDSFIAVDPSDPSVSSAFSSSMGDSMETTLER